MGLMERQVRDVMEAPGLPEQTQDRRNSYLGSGSRVFKAGTTEHTNELREIGWRSRLHGRKEPVLATPRRDRQECPLKPRV